MLTFIKALATITLYTNDRNIAHRAKSREACPHRASVSSNEMGGFQLPSKRAQAFFSSGNENQIQPFGRQLPCEFSPDAGRRPRYQRSGAVFVFECVHGFSCV